ncbi:WEB family protein At1g75720-like [Zingiber officinale]|uniref:Uncharacterized protein n=1 Tax=Zingiber officinale TaxID=94328 RepID=A0A8J5F6U7_ZINOF|nr:WEB family protein At1g75720-like [Zingiber officinale]KAG6482246.1 hypothetical protein ZIOFF_058877 [Zingiber officinale]
MEVHGHASSLPKVQGEVETVRPFRSVKEAVAVFGEQQQQHFLTGSASSQKANNTRPKVNSILRPIQSKPIHSSVSSSPNSCPSSSETTAFGFLRKLEAEVEEIKRELIHMKERESETSKAIATLSCQLQNRSSKLEATESSLSVDQWQEIRAANLEERFEYLPSLREALSIAEMEDQFGRRRRIKVQKKKKKKPIVPLVSEIFHRKKRDANGDLTSSFYSTRSSIYSFT